MSRCLPSVVSFLVIMAITSADSVAQETVDDEAVIQRYMSALERNPRRGTAFDKVYGYHADQGTLEDLVKGYRSKAAADGGQQAAAWMIVGLIETKLGRDAEAIHAFTQAETLDSANSMASYHLGQLLVLTGKTERAVEAFERAIQRQPAAPDLLEVFQALGRTYQRAQRNDKALDVWKRLEQQFPNDARVQEQIATTLLEENDFAGALPRYESLVKSTKDKYRQSLFQVEVAQIKVRLGKSAEGLKDFELLLGQLNPQSWLFRDVRRRIETVFLKGNDQAGLVQYYETWLARHAEDIDAITRLSRLLAATGRAEHAQARLQAGLKLAPSNKELRLMLVDQLLDRQQYHEAVRQYVELDKSDPNNPDIIREWGKVLLKDETLAVADRQQQAAAIWRKLIAVRPKDAHTVIQVADLFRRAGMTDEALELHQLAIKMEPEATQYREYLGEFLHSLKRTDDALATWREIAAGERRTAPNMVRLAEVLAQHDQLTEAIEVNAQACRLDPKNFMLQMKQADLLARADRHSESLQQLTSIRKLISTDEEREAWLQRELTGLKGLHQLLPRIEAARASLVKSGEPGDDQDDWYWLARACDVAGLHREADMAITKARELHPNSLTVLTTAARLFESRRNLRAAIEAHTKIATLNRKLRADSLRRICVLEERLGHREQSLEAGRELLTASPNNSEVSDFVAQLCFRHDRFDEGIQILRRSLRSNPGDLATTMKLASALVTRKQSTEAIELLWQAFNQFHRLEDRLAVIQQLAETHSSLGELHLLVSRLERSAQDPAQTRDMTICLARAYETTNDSVNALRKLETLLTDDSRDTDLLSNLRQLAEKNNDIPAAIRYQRRLWEITTQKSDRYHLASLLLQSGEPNEAVDLLSADSGNRDLTGEMLKLLDGLLSQGKPAALERIKQLRQRYPDSWELVYREGVALGRSGVNPLAIDRFEALVKLKLPDDEPALLRSGSGGPRAPGTNRLPLFEQLNASYNILQRAMSPQIRSPATQRVASAGQVSNRAVSHSVWMPSEFGECRIAAWGWLIKLKGHTRERFMQEYLPDPDVATRDLVVDRLIVCSVFGHLAGRTEAARQLMLLSEDDVEARAIYLKIIGERNSPVIVLGSNGSLQQQNNSSPRLSNEAGDEAIRIYRQISTRPELARYSTNLLLALCQELVLAKREKDVSELIAEAAERASTPTQILNLLYFGQVTVELTLVNKLMDKILVALDQGQGGASAIPAVPAMSEKVAGPLIAAVGSDSKSPEVLTESWRIYLRLLAREASKPVPLAKTPPRVATMRMINGRVARTVVTQTENNMPPMPALVYCGLNASAALETIRQNDGAQPAGDLIALFTMEANTKRDNPDEQLLWQHSLAYLLWKDNQQAKALQILESVVKQFPDRNRLRVGQARQYVVAKQLQDALTILESTSADASVEQSEIDKLVLSCAVAAKVPDRAHAAALRLSRDQAIVAPEAFALARQMVDLKFYQEAEDLLQGATPSQSKALGELIEGRAIVMNIQFLRGNVQQAGTLAREVLRMLENVKEDPFSDKTTGDLGSLRPDCYKVLLESGQLTALIEETEKEFAANPDSTILSNRLSGLYSTSGDRAKQEAHQILMLKKHAEKPEIRFALVLKYLEAGKQDDALDQMTMLLERHPEFFFARCRETVNRLNGRPDLVDFSRLLVRLEWGTKHRDEKKILALHLGMLPTLIEQLWSHQQTRDAANELFIKAWNTIPDRRVLLLQRLRDEHWWNLIEVRADILTLVSKPSDDDSLGKVLGRVIGVGETGPTTVWTRTLGLAATEKRLDGLAAEIDQGLKQSPDWTAGAVMLGLIDLRRGNVEAGRDRLARLFPELKESLERNPNIAWEIAQEMVRYDKSLEIGTRYYQVAIEQADKLDWMASSSPAGALINAYLALGRRSDARDLLLKCVPDVIRMEPEGDNDPTTKDLVQVLSIARRLRSMDYPLEAVEVYMAGLERSANMEVSGYNPRTEIESSFVVVFSEVKPESLVKYCEDLLTQKRVLNLQLFVRTTDPGKGRMYSRWGSLLSEISRTSSLATRTSEAFEQMATSHPDSIEPLVLLGLLATSANDESKLTATVQRLAKFTEEHPLNRNNEAAKAVKRDRMGLWLIVRDCLTRPLLSTFGVALGQHALDSTRLLKMPEYETAILTDWIQIAEDSGQPEIVTRLTNELRQIVR